jgi:hypothetical protein
MTVRSFQSKLGSSAGSAAMALLRALGLRLPSSFVTLPALAAFGVAKPTALTRASSPFLGFPARGSPDRALPTCGERSYPMGRPGIRDAMALATRGVFLQNRD